MSEPVTPAEPRPMILAGPNVGLALMEARDVPVLARWYQDLDFTARLGTPGELQSLEDRQETFERNARIGPTSAEFAVVHSATGRTVGFGGLFDISRALTATLFLAIGEARDRRQGWGAEACRLICDYGFLFRSLHAIRVDVHGYNAVALRMYERVGFRPAGRLRGVNLLNGVRHDEILLDLLRDEHFASAGSLARLAGVQEGA